MFDSFDFERDPDFNYFESGNIQESSLYFTPKEFSSHIRNKLDKITFFHHNIRSFNANSDFVLSIFDSPDIYPEVLVFSETWFRQDNLGKIPGYCDFHTLREQGKSGGVSVFVKNNFNCSFLESLSYANFNIGLITFQARIFNKNFTIIGIYRPQSGSIEFFAREVENISKDNGLENSNLVI